MAIYVTITQGLRGYFAVLVDDHDGPIQSGLGSYTTVAAAVPEAQDWAISEGIPYRAPGEVDKPIDYSQF